MSARDIEAIYPLSPSQQGMMVETLAAPGSGIHVEQAACVLEGELDIAALAAAWQDLVDRHAALRTGFVWDDQPEPVQFVRRQLRLPFRQDDWRGLDAATAERRFSAFIDEDRRCGFALGQPPLMRAALFRIAERRHRFVWSFHHIVMDGWCVPILVAELQHCYAARRSGSAPALAPVRPFRDYIAWLRRQDEAAAARFWHARLEGFTAPTPIGAALGSAATGDRYGRFTVTLAPDASDALRALARRYHLTMNTVLQGAWALVLGAHTGCSDIVFGATVSGRPAALGGVEAMIGPFFNTVPVRITLDPAAVTVDWLAQLQQAQLEQRPFEYCSAAQIHQWSGVTASLRLYDSLLVFENQPRNAPAPAAALRIREPASYGARTGLALALLAGDGVGLEFGIVHDLARLSEVEVRLLVDGLIERLRLIAAQPAAPLGEVVGATALPGAAPAVPAAIADLAHVPPRTVLELQLAAVWERLLSVRPIGMRDNFFALGGHSLLVIKLMSEIERRFGRKLPIAAIFAGPTIERLAGALERAERLPFSPLVAIQPEGTKPPLFCVHPLGGNVICYADLARHLAADRPIYGLQAPGMGPDETPYTDFAAMAEGYVAALRVVQPHGPYYLAGYSFGGLAAFVMARRLRAAGESVALLALLDTPNPHILPDALKYTDSAGLLVSLFAASLDLSPETLRGMEEAAQLAFVLDAAKRADLVPAQASAAEAQRYYAVCKLNHRMAFPAHRYDGSVVLFRASEGATRLTDDPELGWGGLARDVSVVWVPGSHETMLAADHASALAAALVRELALLEQVGQDA